LAKKSIDDTLQEIQADQLTSEWKKVAKKEALRRRAAVWAPRRKTLRNMVILNAEGLPAEDSAAAAAILHQHWKPTFTAKPIDQEACDTILHHTVTVPCDITWRLDFNSFSVMLLLTPNSAPGPDGITYAALKKAGDVAHDFLYRCYCDLLDTGKLPAHFNESLMIFLPKGELEDDIFQTRRTADATRPLNLSNTIAKVIASALSRPLTSVAKHTVVAQQRGFIQGRCLIDNIVELDALLLRAAKYYADKHGLLLLDIKAAFPSLSQEWMFQVLRKMQIPRMVIRALRALYNDNDATIFFNGAAHSTITITSGIKQGCPASGVLFALALDPFLRYLLMRIPPPLNVVTAFADDIAIAARHLLHILPAIRDIFRILAKATALQINIDKTKLIPYWNKGLFEARRYIHDCMLELSKICICDKGLLLGVLMGPGAGQQQMTAATEKYWHRSLEAKTTTNSALQSIRHYNVYAVPTLSYLVQFSPPTTDLLARAKRALQLITNTPWNTFSAATCSSLKDLGFAHEPNNIQDIAFAATFRAALRSEQFHVHRDLAPPDDNDYDQLLHPRDIPWKHDSPLIHMISTIKHVYSINAQIELNPEITLQRRVAALLRSHRTPPWPNFITQRLQRWIPAVVPLDTETFINNVRADGIPDPIRWATLLIVINGIPTTRRMQGSPASCRLCGQLQGDDIEHMIHCCVVLSFEARLFAPLSLQVGPVLGVRRHLLVDNLPRDVFRATLLANFCIVEAHRLLRHGAPGDPQEVLAAARRAATRRHGFSAPLARGTHV
jgi:hypothetical protein